MAFVLLNRYLDVSEAIEDGDAGMIDNSDFTYTDIPSPYDFTLPKDQVSVNGLLIAAAVRANALPWLQFLDEGKREEIRDWVLAISMDSSVSQSLPMRKCHNCHTEMYQNASSCWKCQKQYPTCIVSGKPACDFFACVCVGSLCALAPCLCACLCLVSGMPVLPGQSVNCKNCQSVADKAMWNKFVVAAKICPWCSVAQTPVY